MPRARRIFVTGYYGFGNAGDEAILAGLLADLRAARCDLDVTVGSGDPRRTEAEHGVRAVPRGQLPAVVEALRASDLVLLGGGGLFQDYWDVPLEDLFTSRSGGLPFYLGFPLLAALLGKPAMIYAVGVGPLRTPEGRRLTRAAFELCQAATVRDRESLALLAEIGVPAPGGPPVELAADPAFAVEPAGGEELARLLAGLGLAEGERPVGAALRSWRFGSDPELWEAEVAQGLDRFLTATGERLLFLPFDREDVAVHRRIRAALAGRDRVVLVERELSPAALAGVTGRCSAFLAMRYHAALFALAAGVPVAALAYDPKVSSLMASAGLEGLALAPGEGNAEAVPEALERARGAAGRIPHGFREAMRRQAGRSAAIALDLLDAGTPPASEGRRLLSEVAVGRVLAACGLEAEVAARDARLGEQEHLLAASADLLESERARVEALEQERAALREQRDLLLAERNDYARRLGEIEQTIAYGAVSRFWRLMRLLFPEGSRRRRLYRGVHGVASRALRHRPPSRPVSPDRSPDGSQAGPEPGTAAAALADPRADLLAFEDRVRDSGARQVVAVFSATQLLESEGQRPTQLALAFARRGVPVVFVYWRWWEHEWRPQDRMGEGIVQVPIDVVAKRPEMVLGAFTGLERIALFEFPWPGFFETLAAANSSGWITAYDVLDDWDEFHRVGQAVWYDEPFERHLIAASDAVFAINDVLAGRIRELGGGLVEVVGNGLKTGIEIVRDPRPLPRGEVTVGYFGYLAGAWFDWELIAAAARLRPSWRFYLIGYGGSPEGIELPGTVALLGKQPQRDLAAFAASWDVAVIPFKPDRLAAGADPIKTYEYLAMGLPVVATGVYPPAGGEAFVARAEGAEAFVRAIEEAAARPPEESAARRAFAASCTWDARLEALLASIGQGRQRAAEKRALFGSRP